MRRILPVLLAGALLLSGCGKWDLDREGVQSYLMRRYDREFTFLSSETYDSKERSYLDPRMETDHVRKTSESGDTADVYEDADGVRFHVYHYFRPGVVGAWVVTEDYPVQWLLSKPELYAPLEDSGYLCEYFNTIGMEETRRAGWTLEVSCFADIRPAAHLMFETVRQEGALLPDLGYSNAKQNDDFWEKAILPQIDLNAPDGRPLRSLSFRTVQCPNVTDEENFIRIAEQNYIEGVENGDLRESLPKEIRRRSYGGRLPLYDGEEVIAYLETDWADVYMTIDDALRGEKLSFTQLKDIAGACGYKYTPKDNKVYLTRGDDTILISRTNGIAHDESIFTFYKNGTAYIPEGYADDYLQYDRCCLSVADYRGLLGIAIEVDYDGERAELVRG